MCSPHTTSWHCAAQGSRPVELWPNFSHLNGFMGDGAHLLKIFLRLWLKVVTVPMWTGCLLGSWASPGIKARRCRLLEATLAILLGPTILIPLAPTSSGICAFV